MEQVPIEVPDALPELLPWGKALLVLVVGLLAARVLTSLVGRVAEDRLDAQHTMIAKRFAYWTVLALAVLTGMREVGFDLSVLLGAAGILTVAIGFASQTSASNLISGLFLLGERPFVVGDVVQVGGTLGQVVAIDLLSVKLRTFDNRLVRVPNENLLKSEIVNLTHFRIRRVDLVFQVEYGTDLSHARRVLIAAADRIHLVLDEPRPAVFFDRFADSGISLMLSVWTPRESVVETKDLLAEAVIEAFQRENIAFPFPQSTLGTAPGSPLEVRLSREE